MSLLVKKTDGKTRTVSVRVPAQLAAELDTLRADAEARGYTLDIAAVVTAALQRAIKDARAELSRNSDVNNM